MKWDVEINNNGEQFYSQTGHLLSLEQGISPLAYCLPRYSKLNGSYHNVASTIEEKENGYVSLSLSDKLGNFTNPPIITVRYDRLKTSNGMYFSFNKLSGDYAGEISIEWYKDEQLIKSEEFHPDNQEYMCRTKIKLFNFVRITFNKTSKPYRYIWLAGLKNIRLSDAGGLKVVYEDIALGAKESTNISSDDKDYFVNLENLKQDIEYPAYAMCLPRYSKLNGSYNNSPELFENMGYVSNSISDTDGRFESPPSIVFKFNENYSSVGVTLKFNTYSGDYCNKVNIKWFREDTLLSEKDFTPDKDEYFCYNLVDYYNKIVVAFEGTSKPYRNVFLTGIIFGLIRVFTDNELENVDCLLEVNAISSEISVNTMSYSVKDKLGYDFDFQKKQKQILYFNEAMIGSFYLKDGKQLSKNRYSIETQDAVGLLDSNKFMGGLYANIKIADLIKSIMIGENINYFLDDAYKDKTISGYLPVCNKRQALQQIAFSIGAIVNTGYDRHLYIYPKQVNLTGEFTDENIFTGLSVEHEDLITGVKIYSHEYSPIDEMTELYKGLLTGTSKIEFSEPYHTLNISGGVLGEHDTNYAYISGAGGEVVLTGKKYNHITTVFQKENHDITNVKNIAEVKDATLVTKDIALEVLNRVYEEYINIESIKFKALITEQEVGDIVEVDTGFKGKKIGMIRSLNLNFSKHEVSAEVLIK